MSKRSNKTATLEVSLQGPVWVGIDIHKKSLSVAVRDSYGVTKVFSMTSDYACLLKKLCSMPNEIVCLVYEAGPCGFGLARLALECGIKAHVIAPTRIPRPITRSSKTDCLDCRKLAEYAALGLLHSVFIPSVHEERIRSMQRRRNRLTDKLRKVKAEIKSLLLDFQIEEPAGLTSWSNSSIACLATLKVEEETRTVLDSLLRELAFISEERSSIDVAISKCLTDAQQVQTKCAESVPGIGPVSARTFVTEIIRPERFPDANHLSSFLGLAPVLTQSGQKEEKGSLVQTGQKRLRSLLIECAWIHKSRDAYSEALYKRILARTGHAQKAIVAVARRLGILIWRLCLEKRMYEVRI